MGSMSTRRKLQIASWSSPREGNVYGKLVLDATELERYIEHLRQTTGERVTVTHVVGKVLGLALRQAPGLRGRILFGHYVPIENADVAFLVATEDGRNLAKAKIENADQKSVLEIARELRGRAGRLREGTDEAFNKTQMPMRLLPMWLLRPLVWLTGWLTSALGISIPALGLERFPFGSCIVTSVGMFGLDEGYAPPTPWARVPAYFLVGAVREAPAVVDGALAVRKQFTLTATLDHRFLDGAEAGRIAKLLRDNLENPWLLDEGRSPAAKVVAAG